MKKKEFQSDSSNRHSVKSVFFLLLFFLLFLFFYRIDFFSKAFLPPSNLSQFLNLSIYHGQPLVTLIPIRVIEFSMISLTPILLHIQQHHSSHLFHLRNDQREKPEIINVFPLGGWARASSVSSVRDWISNFLTELHAFTPHDLCCILFLWI